jgi:thymidylate synthase ThyX
MGHAARILADSLSPDGARLTTFEVTFPRIILAEFNTHRALSRNSASSRAIPVEKMLARVEEDPYVPSHWGKNQRGMQAFEELGAAEQTAARDAWLTARDLAVKQTKALLGIGVHKQITNRLLEPFMWQTVVVSATDWSNFFHLRCHRDAHPEIRLVAELMREALQAAQPAPLAYGAWHLPLVEMGERAEGGEPLYWQKVSVGRCARVSYLTHDGRRDPAADVELHDRLLKSGHMSPFEHIARPVEESDLAGPDAKAGERRREARFGNFRGWVQYRKLIPDEQDRLGA